VPVGSSLLGRVVDPLGRPIKGIDPLDAAPIAPTGPGGAPVTTRAPLDSPAPGEGLFVLGMLS
jgi:F0F1-type ATP synthase alpha subunit